MTATTRRLVSAAAAAVLALGLAACGDPTEEGPSPSPTQPPASDGAATSDGGGDTAASDGGGEEDANRRVVTADDFPPPDPALYPGLNTETPQGAEQTAKYFWDHFAWASFTGDTSEMEAMSGEECEDCQEMITQARTNHEEKLFSRPFIAFEREMSSEAADSDGLTLVDYVFTYEVTYADGGEGRWIYYTATGLRWDGERWLIDGLGQQAEEV